MSPGESLAVILVTIIGSLILLFIAACLRGPKISQQIERLSQTNQPSNISDVPVLPNSNSSSNTVIPSINRIRTNYGSTSQFYTSCDFSDMIHTDPPPRYEEINSSPQVTVTPPPSYSSRFLVDSSLTSTTISEVPILPSRIATITHGSTSLAEAPVSSSAIEHHADNNQTSSVS